MKHELTWWFSIKLALAWSWFKPWWRKFNSLFAKNWYGM